MNWNSEKLLFLFDKRNAFFFHLFNYKIQFLHIMDTCNFFLANCRKVNSINNFNIDNLWVGWGGGIRYLTNNINLHNVYVYETNCNYKTLPNSYIQHTPTEQNHYELRVILQSIFNDKIYEPLCHTSFILSHWPIFNDKMGEQFCTYDWIKRLTHH